MKKKMLWLLNSLFWLLLVLILVFAVWFRVSDKTDKSLFGYRIYTVKTNSMKTDSSLSERFKGEAFEKGDLLAVKLKDPALVEVNDVVTFVLSGIEDGSVYLTHRVMEKNTEDLTFITRGDANNMDDPQIEGKQIIGTVVFSVPYAGKPLKAIQDNPYLAIGLAVFFILFLNIITKFFFNKA